jgi:hypothetical protein
MNARAALAAAVLLSACGGRPAPPSVGRRPALLFTPDQVGPFRRSTEATVEAATALMPGERWMRDEGGDAESNDVTITGGGLTLYRGDDGKIAAIQIDSGDYATAAGIRIGSTVAALKRAYADLRCALEIAEVDELLCRSPDLPSIDFHIDLEGPELEEGDVPVDQIAGRQIESIVWNGAGAAARAQPSRRKKRAALSHSIRRSASSGSAPRSASARATCPSS